MFVLALLLAIVPQIVVALVSPLISQGGQLPLQSDHGIQAFLDSDFFKSNCYAFSWSFTEPGLVHLRNGTTIDSPLQYCQEMHAKYVDFKSFEFKQDGDFLEIEGRGDYLVKIAVPYRINVVTKTSQKSYSNHGWLVLDLSWEPNPPIGREYFIQEMHELASAGFEPEKLASSEKSENIRILILLNDHFFAEFTSDCWNWRWDSFSSTARISLADGTEISNDQIENYCAMHKGPKVIFKQDGEFLKSRPVSEEDQNVDILVPYRYDSQSASANDFSSTGWLEMNLAPYHERFYAEPFYAIQELNVLGH